MTDKFISDELINAIDNLQKQKNNVIESKYDIHHNPIISIVRPEWYLSESFRILDNIDIKWENLSIEIISDMVNDMNNINTEIFIDKFERTSSVWYQSYHFLPRTKWGIHIRYDSLLRIAKKFYESYSSFFSNSIDSVKLGFLYLYNHALFHYKIENAASVIEILLNKPNLYFCYYTNIYLSNLFSDYCLEETLANQYMLIRCKTFTDKNFNKITLEQNQINEKSIKYIESNFIKDIRTLLLQIKDCMLNPISTDPIEQIIDIYNPMDLHHNHRVPIWLHKRSKPLHLQNIQKY